MIVGTTETAKILNISTGRLRILLIAGRVEGAYKTGRMWLIPLFSGRPIIRKGKRGPAPRWQNPRKPAKTVVHVIPASQLKQWFMLIVKGLDRTKRTLSSSQ